MSSSFCFLPCDLPPLQLCHSCAPPGVLGSALLVLPLWVPLYGSFGYVSIWSPKGVAIPTPSSLCYLQSSDQTAAKIWLYYMQQGGCIKGKVMSQVAHQARAYPSFRSMKQLGVPSSPLDGMLVHCRVAPSIQFTCTRLYSWVERGTMSMSCPRPQHNVPGPGSNPDWSIQSQAH